MIKTYFDYIKKNTSYKNALLTSFVTITYLLGSALLIGFKTDQLFLAFLFNSLYFATLSSRKFILGFSIFIIFWIIFDSMKAFPNYLINSIHVEDLYLQEKTLFGINFNNSIYTPNEYLSQHATTFLDVLAGFFYLNWVPVPLAFACYLFVKNKKAFLQLSLTFLFVNLIGFVIYYVFPAAPPWYVAEYGFEINHTTPGHTGALARFDDFFGVNVFGSLYSKSSNVFAAMPSLHSAYPVIVLYYGLKNKLGWVNILFTIFMLGIWFSAIYTNHHYTLDVLAGVSCAVVGIFIFQKVLLKNKLFVSFMSKYEQTISSAT
ncbi:phosphatase PAP2 family protein [Aurantibacillus circumpalustris]|uniref:phosphatase PAP2 family protein n=1 Tax=Aurantibacillus circumpalustris TaxID=3036359 RepID=UPI00295B2B18|nr:phosphatase PAP2 family protein [Aurantibacillus circumpalustris]